MLRALPFWAMFLLLDLRRDGAPLDVSQALLRLENPNGRCPQGILEKS